MAGPTQQGMRSVAGTAQNWFYGLPFCTKVTFSLIVGIFVVQRLTGWYGSHDHAVSLIPHSVIHDFQVYRICTAVLVHGGLLHIAFNMLAFVPMAASVEREVGTLQLLYFLVLCSVLEGVIYVALSVLLAVGGLVPDAMYRGVMGFSGVIFGLVVWEAALAATPTRSIFGLFHLPSAWYPWGLLLFCQLLVPEASFFGHLAGLLVGQLWVWGYLRPLAPSRASVIWLEQSWLLSRCVRLHSFILMPTAALPYSSYDTARGGGGGGGGGSAGAGSSGSGGGGGGNKGWLGRQVVALGQLLQNRGTGGEGFGGGGGSGGSAGGGDVEGGGGGGAGEKGRAGFAAGTGRVLGGGPPAAGPAAQPPSVAAALAAEARIRGAGLAGGSGSAGAAGTGPAGGGGAVGSSGSGAAGGAPGGSRDKPGTK